MKKIEKTFEIDLGLSSSSETQESKDIEEAYFPQFDAALRIEAAQMAKAYELFYCLEKTIRCSWPRCLRMNRERVGGAVESFLSTSRQKLKSGLVERMRRARSDEELDYTTFGELGEIIKANWALFGSVFNNLKAVEKVMFNLNSLRNPIAHCSQLAEDEKLS